MDSLDAKDFDSPTWRRLTALLEHRRNEQITKLIRPQTDESVTHMLRGTIKQIDELLALPIKAAPAQPATPAMRSHLNDE